MKIACMECNIEPNNSFVTFLINSIGMLCSLLCSGGLEGIPVLTEEASILGLALDESADQPSLWVSTTATHINKWVSRARKFVIAQLSTTFDVIRTRTDRQTDRQTRYTIHTCTLYVIVLYIAAGICFSLNPFNLGNVV